MRPQFKVLDPSLVGRIVEEAVALLDDPGVQVNNEDARRLLRDAGAPVDEATQVARIPETLVRDALASAPRSFTPHSLDGHPLVQYGGDRIHFDPGSAALAILGADAKI